MERLLYVGAGRRPSFLPGCTPFLRLLEEITAHSAQLYDLTAQKSEAAAGLAPPGGSRGEPVPCFASFEGSRGSWLTAPRPTSPASPFWLTLATTQPCLPLRKVLVITLGPCFIQGHLCLSRL